MMPTVWRIKPESSCLIADDRHHSQNQSSDHPSPPPAFMELDSKSAHLCRKRRRASKKRSFEAQTHHLRQSSFLKMTKLVMEHGTR